jgi:hypothetical protein
MMGKLAEGEMRVSCQLRKPLPGLLFTVLPTFLVPGRFFNFMERL